MAARKKKVKNLFFDMDGVLAEFRIQADRSVLYQEGYFRDLPPVDSVVQAARRLKKDGYSVYVLSSFLTDSKYALQEKLAWARENLPFAQIILTPYGDSKAECLEHYLCRSLTKNDYLIDDFNQNLWDFRDGTPIKLLNGINSASSWLGHKVTAGNCYNELKEIIEQ